MDHSSIILIIFVVVVFFSVFILLKKDRKCAEDRSLLLIQNQVNEVQKTIKEVTQELIRVEEGQKQVINIADQLKQLQDVLKNPKQRGVLGEYYLETVLKNVLPPSAYKTPYNFKNGEAVDAAIIVKDKIIPVDSKFSLENYNRILKATTEDEKKKCENNFRNDLKLRIDETSKYIKPEEGTMDFAFMFIPSEAVYYDLLVDKIGSVEKYNLLEYAFVNKKVIIVSPTTFLAFLQTVLQGLRALKIEESAKEIRERVERLGRHLSNYEIFMKKMGDHLSTTVNAYDKALKEFKRIDKDILKIAEGAAEIKSEKLKKPEEDH